MSVDRVAKSSTRKYTYPHQKRPLPATKYIILTCGGVAIVSDWQDGLNHVAYAELPTRDKEVEQQLREQHNAAV